MDIELNQPVVCESGNCRGSVTRIIFNPVQEDVAAVVVREDEPPNRELVVPVRNIQSQSAGQILLRGSRSDLEDCPPFEESHYMRPAGWRETYSGYLLLPYVLSKILMQSRENVCLSLDQLPVRRGALVEATDGTAGRIEEFLIDAVNCKLTHLVMNPQMMGGRRKVSIPLDVIEQMDRQTVKVRLSGAELKKLPRLPIWEPETPEPDCLRAADMPLTMPQPEAIRELITGLTSRNGQKRMEARHRLVGIGPSAIDQLLPLLEHKKPRIRWEAAKTLAQIADPACIPGLLLAMNDNFFDIRWVAAEAFAELGLQGLEPLLQELIANPHSAVMRDSAHHVLRSLVSSAERFGISEQLAESLSTVMLTLEELHPVASLPQVAQKALDVLHARRDEGPQRWYNQAYR